ncbi:hypothetical protein [Aeromicrobium sp. UC242_57]|uniref:hypothetical protein n=1 Tax=Aeromicrobium sp. UC242_57 TaxID=3374624 RepID=UPI0037A26521
MALALKTGLMDEATVFRMTRALGTTMSKLADWQVSALVEQVEHDVHDGKSETPARGGRRPGAHSKLPASRASWSTPGAGTSPLRPPASRRWGPPTKSCCRPR